MMSFMGVWLVDPSLPHMSDEVLALVVGLRLAIWFQPSCSTPEPSQGAKI